MHKYQTIKCRGYKILVGNSILSFAVQHIDVSKYSKVILITEEKIYNLWQSKIEKCFNFDEKILLPTGEKIKTFQTVGDICNKLISCKTDRKSLIVNLGGGMITDLGGFCASIYMRGINYVNIPTSLLGMIDASIGGKNGVNLNNTKNIIGNFNEPKFVIIDTEFLQTLPKREFNSAYGEIIKYAIIGNKKNLINLKHNNIFSDLNDIIIQCLKVKKNIIESDFYEQNKRKLLNFGHTIGHAIEGISLSLEHSFLHGEAVLIGMFFETMIAENKQLIKHNEAIKIYKYLYNYRLNEFLSIIKANADSFKIENILLYIHVDKKNSDKTIKMVLPISSGKCKYNIVVSDNEIIECLKKVL